MKNIKQYIIESLGEINKLKEHPDLKITKQNKEVVNTFLKLKPGIKDTISFLYSGMDITFDVETKQDKSAIVKMSAPEVGEEYEGAYYDCLQFMFNTSDEYVKNHRK